MPFKRLGNKKGHVAGDQVAGRHTTVMEDVDKILRKIADKDWFLSVRTRPINCDSSVGGGQQFVAIKPHSDPRHKNTVVLTFKKAGRVQKVDVHIDGLEENKDIVVADITEIVTKEWHRAKTCNQLDEPAINPADEQKEIPKGADLLAKWNKTGRGRSR